VLLQHVEPAADAEQQRAARHRYGDPLSLELGQILDARLERPIAGDDVADEVVDGLQRERVLRGFPVGELHDVVARSGLRFGRDREQQLVTLRGDEVDLDVDLFLLSPLWMILSATSFAPGTQWSHKPMDRLPAALALRTNGAAIVVADAATDVATKRRRVNALLVIAYPPLIASAARPDRRPKGQERTCPARTAAPCAKRVPPMRRAQVNLCTGIKNAPISGAGRKKLEKSSMRTPTDQDRTASQLFLCVALLWLEVTGYASRS